MTNLELEMIRYHDYCLKIKKKEEELDIIRLILKMPSNYNRVYF